MTVKKIRMRPEGTNDYADILHPETSADLVLMSDGVTTVSSYLSDITQVKNATITIEWVGSTAPYTQEINIQGIKDTDKPIISPVYSTALETAILEKEAWNMISKIETGTDKLIVTCFEDKPTITIPIQIKGV